MTDRIPLCVDLDGTLVRTDMLHEATLELLKRAPLSLARLPGWLAQGKAAMKHRISEAVQVEVAHLPYRREDLDLIEAARAEGRPVVLATASSAQIAEAVARHLGLFDLVLASDGATNLSAEAKAERLVAVFGERGFDYIGNGRADLRSGAGRAASSSCPATIGCMRGRAPTGRKSIASPIRATGCSRGSRACGRTNG
jgi:phosphoserine phosphatase